MSSVPKTTVGADSAAGAHPFSGAHPVSGAHPAPGALPVHGALPVPGTHPIHGALPVSGAHPVPGAVAWYRSVLSSADEGDHSRFVPGYGVHSQETPLSLEELLSPEIARGGAVSYRKSRASIFNDMSSEDLDRWMKKFGQAKLELRGMTDLYEEYGGDNAADELLRDDGEALQDAVPYEEAFETYIKDYTHKMFQEEAEAAEEQAFLKGLWEAQHGTEDKTHDAPQKNSKKPSRAQMMERQKETDAELQKVAAMHSQLCAKVVALEAEINLFREKSRIIELMWEENLKATKISVSENNDFKGDPYVKKKRSYTPAEIKHIQEMQDDQVTQDWIERLMAGAAGDGSKEVESPTIDGEDWVEVSDA
ncbi:hypothetical protein D6D20_09534 [Aureobasidium pullulans]|uniref:Uncharacterized protein n=1 Tax=Aureobasidium pullulans TaxID=5580 RepID=A0A4V4ILR1_AURPU|nr:hypothetical protein D6D20_09534 [Aureobasidium pullulans]